MRPKDAYTTRETAELIGISRGSVIKLTDNGHLKCSRAGPTGDRCVKHVDLLRFANANDIPLNFTPARETRAGP